MAGFSGSYRAQMEASNELRAASADFSDAMSTAASNAEFTGDFLKGVNDPLGDLLGEYGDMLDSGFTPPGRGRANWSQFMRDGLDKSNMPSSSQYVPEIPEAAADAAAFASAEALALVGGMALGYASMEWAFAPDLPAAYTYNFPPDWLNTCNNAPQAPFPKMGINPPPPGWPSFVNGTCTVSTVNSANGPIGSDVPAGSTRVQLVWSGAPWPNRNGFTDQIWTHAASPAAGKVPAYQNGSRNRISAIPVPASVTDPFPDDGDARDQDHPRNRPLGPRWRWSWRDSPPDPWKWSQPGPDAGEPPPDGGTSGGGGSSGGFDPGSNPDPPPHPQAPGYPFDTDVPGYKIPAVEIKHNGSFWEDPENEWHMLVPDYAIKILIEYGLYKEQKWFKSPEGLEHLFATLAKSIPDHPCVGLKGSARVKCVTENLGRVSWKHFAGQIKRDAVKSASDGLVRTPLPNWDRRAKKAWKAVRAVHNAFALGQKRSRVFSGRKGMS